MTSGEYVAIPAPGAPVDAYLAKPPGAGRHPGVLVIHEIFGLNPHIEDVARRFAAAGYVALAPEVMDRPGRVVSKREIEIGLGAMMKINPQKRGDPAEMARVLGEFPESDRATIVKTMGWLQRRDMAPYVPDLRVALDWLASQPFVNGQRVAAVGFCYGGGLSARLASSGAPLAACVFFYGDHPPLDEVTNIRCPVLGLYGGEDPRITNEVPKFEAAMKTAGKRFEHHTYPGAPHAFFADPRPTFRPDAAADAWNRVLAFFGETLGTR
ncbi:MAG: dienelactone hydrolase family protein [Thermoplasmatota archaeon]